MEGAAGAGSRSRTLPVLAGLSMSVAVGFSFTNVGSVAPELADDYGVALSSIGFLTMIVIVLYALAQLPTGRALDRIGPAWTGTLGLLGIVAANGIALTAPVFGVALGARALLGVATPLAYLAGIDMLRRYAGGSAQLISVSGSVNGAGMGIALFAVPQLEPALAWRAPFLASLVLAAVALAAVLPVLRPGWPAGAEAGRGAPATGAAGATAATGKRTAVPFRQLLRDPVLLRFSLMNMSAAAFTPIISSWVVSLLVEAGGASTKAAGAVGSLSLLASVASRPLAGQLIHRRPQVVRSAVRISAGLGAGGCVALLVVGPRWLSAIGCVLIGIASAVPWTFVFTRAPHVRPGAAGSSLAVVGGIPLLVAIAGIPLVGATFGLPGDGRIGFAGVAVLWALLVLVVPPRER